MAKHIFGAMPTTMPAGFSKRIHFPNLANLNMVTGDHRRLEATGGSARGPGPWTIRTQPSASYGHEGAIPSGTLFEITIDEDTEIASGDGFLLDDEWGLKTVYWVTTGAQNKNSIDLADIKARFVEDLATGEYWVDFTKWAIAATTIVATPAFADAHGEIVASAAGMIGDPMDALVCDFAAHEVYFDAPMPELTADASGKVPFERFYVPEPPRPQKIIVDEHRRVYGHLGLWESCHDGIDGQCVMIPRPQDAYSSFNKPGVLTSRGMVQTGPIFALGGHRPLKGKVTTEEEQAAYGGIENAWADVRVVEGVHGPWLSGVVRPGVDDNTVYAARASRISGHWKGDKLKAIVSVNAEGYDVPGDGSADPLELDLVAGFAYSWNEDEGVSELVASFPDCVDGSIPAAPDDTERVTALIRQVLADNGIGPVDDTQVGPVAASAVSQQRRQILVGLLLDDDDD